MSALTPLTEFDYHQRLAEVPGVALVLFSSPECGSCRAVERRLPEAAGDRVTALFKVDVREATALARAFDVFHLPTLFLYRDGRFHAVLQSEVTAQALQRAIAAALAAPAQEEP